jgi:arylsulfatase A-like enzyme
MLGPDEPVLLKNLKDNGYFVWWGGKNDLVPGENGFEKYCDVKYQPIRKPNRKIDLHEFDDWRGSPDGDNYYSFFAGKLNKAEGEEEYYDNDWAMVNGAVDFIKNLPEDKPVCIYLPLGYPHPPYGVEDPWYSIINRDHIPTRTPTPEEWEGKPSLLKGIYERQGLQNWTEDRWTELRATYYGMCARLDYQFNILVKSLKEAGIYDETAIFLFSDHGDFTGDYGLVEKTQNTFEDCLSRVPFIIKPPASIDVKPGISDALVELIDFSATVYELTGISPEHTHFGRSLIPILKGETETHRDAVFCEGGRLHGESHCMELESSSSTVTEGLYWPRVGLQIQEGPEHTKAVMCRTKDFKYVRRLYETDELYDMKTDPQEMINKINDPEYAEILVSMKERLLTFYQETSDVVPFKTNKR